LDIFATKGFVLVINADISSSFALRLFASLGCVAYSVVRVLRISSCKS
jgi:hypothetical protein